MHDNGRKCAQGGGAARRGQAASLQRSAKTSRGEPAVGRTHGENRQGGRLGGAPQEPIRVSLPHLRRSPLRVGDLLPGPLRQVQRRGSRQETAPAWCSRSREGERRRHARARRADVLGCGSAAETERRSTDRLRPSRDSSASVCVGCTRGWFLWIGNPCASSNARTVTAAAKGREGVTTTPKGRGGQGWQSAYERRRRDAPKERIGRQAKTLAVRERIFGAHAVKL
jgi:hypothetical protein